jgi:hypothetical protein
MIRFFVPLLVLAFSFSSGDKNFPAQKTNSPDSVKTATDSILDRWLDHQTVENNIPRFKSLWFFVSRNELDSIESSQQLLRSFRFETTAQQRYYSWLTDAKFDQQPVASILRASEKLRIRDAWTSYWPLIRESGMIPLPQGDQLIRVELEDSSLFVQFQPQEKNPFAVYDVYGNIVSLPQAIKREKHIAAVFMNYSRKENVYDEFGFGKMMVLHHRSFYLVNEKMIRHWEHATPSMQDGIIKELNYLLLLNAWINDSPSHIGAAGKKGKNIVKAWNIMPVKRTIPEKIFACRRSSTPFDANGAEIDRAIATIRRIWPLQVKTMEKFPSRGIR